jgi:DNA repair photolyase
MKTYKHFATISSQLYFCSSPIRLDSYNRCQFGCAYCFSRNRSLEMSSPGLKIASPAAFANRLSRVARGEIHSAFDEFLARRIPIQLGALQDPFSGIETKYDITLDLLRILHLHDYPTLISTKSLLPGREPYISLLKKMNAMVRFSAAGVREECRRFLEIGCPEIDEIIITIKHLAAEGVRTSLRIQPVIPDHEEAALDLARRAARSGVHHISFEYLKIGTEDMQHTLRRISGAVGTDIWQSMAERGIKRVGRDYTLTASAKCGFVRKAKQLCHDCGVKFGAGDTEFIHLSDGIGCCNGSGYFLRKCTQFRSNFVGILSGRREGEKIRFSDLRRYWAPKRNVHAYLTTDSRGRDSRKEFSSWMSLLARRWNGGKSPYSPSFFFGIKWTGKYDKCGFKVYQVTESF